MFSMTLMTVCVLSSVLSGFGHRQLGKRFLFILVFLLEKLWARKDVVFYGIFFFFIRKSLLLARITHHL